jgi:hypothetical protein
MKKEKKIIKIDSKIDQINIVNLIHLSLLILYLAYKQQKGKEQLLHLYKRLEIPLLKNQFPAIIESKQYYKKRK